MRSSVVHSVFAREDRAKLKIIILILAGVVNVRCLDPIWSAPLPLMRARRRFFRTAARRGADPRPGTVLRYRSSACAMRWGHAVQLPVAARQAPSRPPTLL